MNQQEPLDLRSLATVDSPELVSGALRRFRRRIFSTGAVVLVAALGLTIGIVRATIVHQTLEERIERSPGRAVGVVYREGGATVVLTRVADVDSGLGLSFVVASSDTDRGRFALRLEDVREFDLVPGSPELHFVVGPPADRTIEATVVEEDSCRPSPDGSCVAESRTLGTFSIDLEEIRVPGEL